MFAFVFACSALGVWLLVRRFERLEEARANVCQLSLPCFIPTSISTTAEPTPDEKAASIINSVPSTSLFTKTSGVLLGTGLTAAAISTELYVANEETVLAVGFLVILAAIASSIGAPYNSWANGHIDRIKGILNGARAEHTKAITERIDSVGQLKEVVPLTQSLYAVAKVCGGGKGVGIALISFARFCFSLVCSTLAVRLS